MTGGSARIVVIGAGPGGVAAARRVKDRSEAAEVILIEREGAAEYLPGTISTLLGETSRERWRQRVALDGVEVRAGEVAEVSGSGARLDGEWLQADCVIAAPGLRLDMDSVPDLPNLFAVWDPAGAETATNAVRDLRRGAVAVVISSLPYRCPPAPYSLAMQLAALYGKAGGDVGVVLATPEEEPLAALGGGVPEFLRESCAAAGVDLHTGFDPDLASSAPGGLRSSGGDSLGYDLALVIPPHVRSPLLAGLPGGGPLVEVSPRFESAESGLFVVGDAAATPLPRAADAAASAGRTAADAALSRLDHSPEEEPHVPEPECFVGHGGGLFSRVSLRFPDGIPPQGAAEITLEGPSSSLAREFEEAFVQWRSQRSAG